MSGFEINILPFKLSKRLISVSYEKNIAFLITAPYQKITKTVIIHKPHLFILIKHCTFVKSRA